MNHRRQRQVGHWRSLGNQGKVDPSVNPERYQQNLPCAPTQQREEIEAAFIGWRSPASVAEEFGLGRPHQRIPSRASAWTLPEAPA